MQKLPVIVIPPWGLPGLIAGEDLGMVPPLVAFRIPLLFPWGPHLESVGLGPVLCVSEIPFLYQSP